MKETLTARLIDRPIRPMFPKWFRDEVQIQNFVLSSDRQTDGDVLAMNGASAALAVSELPFEGPVGSVRLGCVRGEWVPFPTFDELEESDLDLIVSGTQEAVMMIEGFAREMPEDQMVEAVMECHKYIQQICELQVELATKVGVQKKEYEIPPSDGIYDTLRERYYEEFKSTQQTEGKQARADACDALKNSRCPRTYSGPQCRRRNGPRSVQRSLA